MHLLSCWTLLFLYFLKGSCCVCVMDWFFNVASSLIGSWWPCLWWVVLLHSTYPWQLLVSHLEPLTEQQLMGICNLQQSSQQAEDALSQGMEALQQSLAETLASGSLGPSGSSANVANYMGQMAMAMGKLETLEGFLRQVLSLLSCSFQLLI